MQITLFGHAEESIKYADFKPATFINEVFPNPTVLANNKLSASEKKYPSNYLLNSKTLTHGKVVWYTWYGKHMV